MYVIEIVMRQGEKENLAERLASVTSYGTIIHKRPSCLQYTVQSPQDSSTSRLLRQGSRSLQEKHTTQTLIFCHRLQPLVYLVPRAPDISKFGDLEFFSLI